MGLKTLLAELRHRGVYKVATVYLVVGLTALEGLTHLFHNFEAPHWVLKVLSTLILIGFPVACLTAWGFEFTPQGVHTAPALHEEPAATPRHSDWILGGLLALVFAFLVVRLAQDWREEPAGAGIPVAQAPATLPVPGAPPATAGPPSVAVLPFVDMSPQHDQQYFGDGIAEELLSALTRVEGLRVAARTSTFVLQARGASLQEIGDTLHVQYALEGSVRRAGDRVRITAQLIDVRTGYHLFSQDYDRGIADVLAIQEEIARELVRALLPKLGIDASTPLLARETANPGAHDLRLKARRFFASPGRDTAREAITLLEQAVALDPAYAAAWGDLSRAYMSYGIWGEPMPAMVRATEASTRALALDPDNALALITRGSTAAVIEYDQEAAADYFRRAREAGVDQSFWAYSVSGAHLMPLGRYAEAAEILRQARDLDPYEPPVLMGEIIALMNLGRVPEAVALARTVRVEASPPPSLAQVAASALILSGSLAEAEPLVAYVTARSGQFASLSIGPQALLNSARHDDVANRQLLDALMAQRQAGNYVSPYMIGAIHDLLAEYDEALDWFERAVDAHDPLVVYLMPTFYRRHPVIGTHPRFLALLKRLHLPSQAELDAARAAAERPRSAP